uniref:Uncharacterized protein n=1 Tax=Sinocyclocheilus rhinocerous TaxID=307959 RepID=A0A673KC03_9TELE
MKTAAFLCFSFTYFSENETEMKSVEDVYEFLWENNIDIAYKTIRGDFLIQMQNGNLNYVLKVAEMLKKMSANVTQPNDLKDFLSGRYSSYKGLGNLMLNQYFFEGEPPIQQTPAMRKYLAFYRNLMDNEEPLYFAVGLLPCARLWVWLAKNLNTPPTNAYYTWKVENMGGHPEKHYRALLNKYLITPEKVAKANAMFRAQMQNEHDFFFSS